MEGLGFLGLPQIQPTPSWRLYSKHLPRAGLPYQNPVCIGTACAMCYRSSKNHCRQTVHIPPSTHLPHGHQKSLYRAQVWRHSYWELQVRNRERWTKYGTLLTEFCLKPSKQLLPYRGHCPLKTFWMRFPLCRDGQEGSASTRCTLSVRRTHRKAKFFNSAPFAKEMTQNFPGIYS